MDNPLILAIETSCDDTAVTVSHGSQILSHVVSSQLDHAEYGGIIPEVASRRHLESILPVVQQALKESKIQLPDLHAIAFTKGPGLLGSLIVGTAFAKSMAQGLDIPLIGVHHMQAHVLSNFIEEPRPDFPLLCLTISGGHTQIVEVHDFLDMHVIGWTLDDAAGEAFDKIGKMMGLPYPAGPKIDELAQQGDILYHFPEPNIDGLDFSFSGLKTSVMRFLKKNLQNDPDFIKKNLHHLCASVQERICSILIHKLEKAAEKTDIKNIALAGGVSANSRMRATLLSAAKEHGWKAYFPAMKYCTDNASMIAFTAYHLYKQGQYEDLSVAPQARMAMNSQSS